MSAGADIMCRLDIIIFYLFDNNSWRLSCHPTIFSNYGVHWFCSVPLCLYAAAPQKPLISLKPFKGTRLASTATRSLALKTRKGWTARESKRWLWGPGWLGALPVRSRGSLCRWPGSEKSPSDLVCRRRWRTEMLRITSMLFEGSTSETSFDLWAGGWLRTWNR